MTQEPLDATSRVRRRPDVLFAPINEDLLALDETNGQCYSLNEVAAQLWQWMEAPQLIADLCARLQQEYEVEPERCGREVLAVLEGLRKVGLVEAATDAT